MTPTALRPPWPRLVALVIGLAAIVGVVVLAFLWPTATAGVHRLPLGVVAPASQAEQLESALDERAPDAFDVRTLDDRDAAVTAIQRREVYGAIVLDPAPEVLVASAASPAVSQLLGGLAPALGQQLTAAAAAQGIDLAAPIAVDVTDVVPLVEGDARGAVLAASAFPLVLGGVLGGVVVGLLVVGRARRVVALVGYALLGGLAVAGVLQGVFGALPGPFGLLWLAFSLALLAVSATIGGLGAVLGRAGVGLGAALMMLVANPLSAAAVPVEFLVSPWGAVGQWLPAGAAVTLVRDIAYFPDADVLQPWLVLAGWAVAGLALAALGRATPRVPAREGAEARPASA